MEISKAPFRQEEIHNSEDLIKSEMTISQPVTDTGMGRSGIVVDADRELRIKLYMGQVCAYCFPHASPYAMPWQVFMAWLWFIPAFHIAPETPSSSFVLPRDELDFPIGIGKDIIDVELKMEWCQDEVDDTQVETAQTDSPLSGVEAVVASLAGGVEVGQAVES